MQLKDATRSIGRVGLLLPLILIFLTAADSAIACPGHSKVAHRTRAINTRTVSYMPATVITYRAPASYRRCGASMYDTRGAKYVTVRNHGSSARYVAVRNYAPQTRYVAVRNYAPRTRYVAVRNVDYDDDDDDLRHVAIRRNVYRPEAGTRHIAVRSGYRKGNGIVAYIDDQPHYVAVRRVVPQTRYVAVRHVDDEPRYVAVRTVAPRHRYVAVRNIDSGCTRAVALRSCLGETETTSVRRVVLRDDDQTLAKHVVLRDEIDDDDVEDILENDIDDDDDEYITVSNAAPTQVEYADATYSDLNNNRIYIAANDFDSPCARTVAVRTCRPEALSTRTITYEVSDDDDWDDEAFLHRDATYVAARNVGDACLSRQVVYTSPEVVTTRSVRYIPASVVAEDSRILDSDSTAFVTEEDTALLVSEPASVETEDDTLMVSEPTAVVAEDASFMESEPEIEQVVTTQPRWVAMDEDRRFDDLDPSWVAEVEATTGADSVSYVPGGDVEVGGTAVSWIPANDVDDAVETQAVSYVPAEDVEESDMETVSYVTTDADVEDTHMQAVSYVPADNHVSTVRYVQVANDDDVDTTYIAADDDCPIMVSDLDAEPVYSTVLHEKAGNVLVSGVHSTQQIAGSFGYRDGFEDGQEAALEGDVYHPENSGDFQKATEGYEDEFGDKGLYKEAYRDSYLDGYRAGFASGNSV